MKPVTVGLRNQRLHQGAASYRLIFLLFLFLITLSPGRVLNAQEPSDSSELVTQSLDLDIETSRRDELEAWCLVLNLSNIGDDEVLKRRLRAYYGLGVSGGDPDVKASGGTRIVIESAGRSEYFKVSLDSDETEKIIRLSGEVIITVSEPDRGRTHRVEADSVIFNQSQNTISAIGNILYTVDTGGREEQFTGDSLTFEVNNWTGVIFRGTSQRQQSIEDETVDFFFRGESIKRSGPDILVLSDGVITSHNVPNPDYALKAKKIWITGPGEWGLFSATLYVGHVPVLYLPFYWKSGSDMLFNPVIGFRTRVGYYLQTTTYLMGQKEKDDGFSIMGFGDSANSDYNLERDGVFLVRSNNPDSEKPAAENTLKYMLDIYTTLGAMTGLFGDFPQIGKNGSMNFYATIGVSRSINSDGSVYFNDGSQSSVYWNNSYLGKYVIPFRWGTKFDISLNHWSIYMDWYSDPYYLEDFGNRKENLDWLSFLLGEEGTDQNDPDLVTDMRWEISGSESVSPEVTGPWLKTLSMDSFRTSLTWKNKINEDIAGSGKPDASFDPARNFYYPDRVILPDIKLSLKGGSPQWEVNRLDAPESEEDESSGTEAAREPAEGPEPVPFEQSFDAVYTAGLLKASLNYGLQTQLFIEDRTDSSSWQSPSDIDFVFNAARINSTQRGDLSYNVDLWDGLTGISGSTNMSGYYQIHADIFGNNAPVTDTTRLEDYQYTKLLWDNRFSMYLKPFQGVPSLSESSLNYSIDANLFSRQLSDGATVNNPDYTNTWIADKEDFRQHEASGKASWKPGIFNFALSGTADIPPLDQRYTLNANTGLEYKGFKVNLSQQSLYVTSVWTTQPFLMGASWTGWDDEVTFAQSARYSVEDYRISNAESLFRFWGFETRFVANYGVKYKWNKGSYFWEEDGEGFNPSTLKFSYKREFNPLPMWKNRISTRTILDTAWNINLNQPTDNVFGFKWTQEFHIFKFLDLQLSFSSTNRSMYLYFPWWREELGVTGKYNFFEDLLKSFNMFNIQDRRDSQFNMDRFELSFVHHLRSWDLSVEYSGWPALDSGSNQYRWKSEFNLFVQWNPLPMFNQRTKLSKDSWNVDSFE